MRGPWPALATVCLVAVPAGAARSTGTFPIDDPSFWSHQYKIPGVYEIVSFSLESRRPRRLFSDVEKILLRHGGMRAGQDTVPEPDSKALGIASQWKIPAAAQRDALRDLIGLGGLYRFSRWEFRRAWGVLAGDDPRELYVKRDSLAADWSRIRPFASTMPAIADLVAEQRRAVEHLLALHDAARRFVHLSVMVADSTREDSPTAPFPSNAYAKPPHLAPPAPIERLDSARPAGYWQRKGFGRGCGAAARPFQLTLISSDPVKAALRVEAALSRAGARAVKEGCMPPMLVRSTSTARTDALTIARWVDPKRLDRLKPGLAAGDAVGFWSQVRASTWPPIDSSASEKERVLRRELRLAAPFLEQAPAVRTLVRAELSRLEPVSKEFRATSGKSLLNVVILPGP